MADVVALAAALLSAAGICYALAAGSGSARFPARAQDHRGTDS